MRKLRAVLVGAAIATLTVLVQIGNANAETDYLSSGFAGYENYYGAFNNISYEGVEMEFNLPYSDDRCGASPDALPIWVGLEGANPNNPYAFTQNGFNINEGNTITGAWFEWWDKTNNATDLHITNVPFSANPGDDVRLREIWGSGHHQLWATWENLTTGQYVMRNFDIGINNFPFNAEGMWQMERWTPDTVKPPEWPRIPYFSPIHVTGARIVQASTETDSHGVPLDGAYVRARDHDDAPNEVSQEDMLHWSDGAWGPYRAVDMEIWNIDQYPGQFTFHSQFCQ